MQFGTLRIAKPLQANLKKRQQHEIDKTTHKDIKETRVLRTADHTSRPEKV